MNNAYFHFPYIGLTKGSVDKSFSVKKFTDKAGEDDTGFSLPSVQFFEL